MTGGFIDNFSHGSDAYRIARPAYPASLVDALAALAPGRSLAWDAGCGNGQAARSLVAHFDQVLATDPSAEQIAAAEPAPGLEYRVEQAERVPLSTRVARIG